MTINYAELDPGIRDVVRLLNEHGFSTTDSGDGVSKPSAWFESGEALRAPHVACTITPQWFFKEAHRLAQLLGKDWHVEGSYAPDDGVCILLAVKTAADPEATK